ncbi:MAG: hypothetical protein KBF99_07100 [Leptospiraceae bacterium]|nr:hypothetical protein [Leptospiraceae bacterium]MBK9501304.1 hypothetical protein [Leptospiraceae bacterium]MBP9162932.1 hypothetical protein [Leptospiraceae bacterium]
MIDRIQKKILRLYIDLKDRWEIFQFRFLKSKWNVTIFIAFLLLSVTLFIVNNFYAYYVRKNYVNIYQVKSSIVTFIRKNLSKAVEIGIADFSSLQGIIFEDIKISQEEDFSSNKLLFTSKRIDVRLTSLFSKAIVPEKIVIYSAKLTLDIDDPMNVNVLKHIHELNLPDIYFDNLEIQLRANNQDLLRSTRPIHVSILRKNQILEISFNDNKFLGILAGSLKGSGKINLETTENSLRIDFSDEDLENMSGISKILLNLTPESGLADGFISMNKTQDDFSIDGNLNFRKFSGDFFPISNIKANDFTINAKFSYLKEFTDPKTSESYFKRKISSPEFFYDEQVHTPANNLRKTTISIRVDNFNKLLDRLVLEEDVTVKGNMQLNMRLEETGRLADWIWIDGNGSLNDLEFQSNTPSMRLTDTSLKFNWSQNELHTDLKGKLFDKDFNAAMNGTISFTKAAKEAPVSSTISNLKLNVNLDSLILKSFQSIYDSIAAKVSSDIKERQEKMLPETFFVQSALHKVFLEKANVKANMKIGEVKYRPDSHSQGSYNLDLKIESGAGNLVLTGGIIDKKENELNLNFYYDRKVPAVDFRTRISSLVWLDETFDLCDSSIYTDIINFNMSFVSGGNNFSDLLVNRSIAGELNLIGNSFIRSNPGDNVNLSEMFLGQSNLDISLGFNAYSQEGFIRNIEVKSKELDLRGNASLVRSDVNYIFYGQLKNKPQNIAFTKTGASCQKSKK